MRTDLLKWKIVLIAGLSAVGLGLVERGESGKRYADLVLCAIPFAAAYVDLLCRQLHLRIQVIGCFRRAVETGEYQQYEIFAGQADERGAFGLESAALIGASVLLCVVLLLAPQSLSPALPHALAINISAGVGLVLVLLVELRWQHLRTQVESLEPRPPGH